jgi:hypothetical protein
MFGKRTILILAILLVSLVSGCSDSSESVLPQETLLGGDTLSIEQSVQNTSVGDPAVYQSFTAAHNNLSRYEITCSAQTSDPDWVACLTDSFGGACFADTSCDINCADTSNFAGCTIATPYGTTVSNTYYLKFTNSGYPNNRLKVVSSNQYSGGQLCTDGCYSTYDLMFKIYYESTYSPGGSTPIKIPDIIFFD